jgi:hypothetical protein
VKQPAHLDLRLQQGDLAGTQAIRNIMVAEKTKEMWRQNRYRDSPSDCGLTTLEIPSDGDFSTNHGKACNFGPVLTDPLEIRHALFCRIRLQSMERSLPFHHSTMQWTEQLYTRGRRYLAGHPIVCRGGFG